MLVKFLPLVKYFLFLKTHRPLWGCCFKRNDLLVSQAEQGNEKNLYLPFFLLCINFKRLKSLICESPQWALLLFSNMRWFPSSSTRCPKSTISVGAQGAAQSSSHPAAPWATPEKSLSFPGCPAWVCPMLRFHSLAEPAQLPKIQGTPKSLPKATSRGCWVAPKAIRDLLWESTQHWAWGWRGVSSHSEVITLIFPRHRADWKWGSRAQSHLSILDPLRVHFPHHSHSPEGPTGTKRAGCTLQQPDRLCGDLNSSENIFEILQLRWFCF